MFPTMLRRAEQSAQETIVRAAKSVVMGNAFKTRKVWPPNFKELAPQQQLRFEKKYKRRILMASRSPRWEKGVKYAQLITIAAAMVWLLFYSEFEWWGQEYKPSVELRKRAATIFGILDPDKRYERPDTAPEPPPPKTPESR